MASLWVGIVYKFSKKHLKRIIGKLGDNNIVRFVLSIGLIINQLTICKKYSMLIRRLTEYYVNS